MQITNRRKAERREVEMDLTLVLDEDERHLLPEIHGIIANRQTRRQPEIKIEINGETQPTPARVSAPSPDLDKLKADAAAGLPIHDDDRDALIAEIERLTEQRRKQEISIAQVVVFANELGWDGANNSKILANFLRDAFAKAKTLGAVEELEQLFHLSIYVEYDTSGRGDRAVTLDKINERAAELRKELA
jgi:hypothetical protein